MQAEAKNLKRQQQFSSSNCPTSQMCLCQSILTVRHIPNAAKGHVIRKRLARKTRRLPFKTPVFFGFKKCASMLRIIGINLIFLVQDVHWSQSFLWSQEILTTISKWSHHAVVILACTPPSQCRKEFYGLNSHYVHIIGDGYQPNSRGFCTHYQDFPVEGEMTIPNIGSVVFYGLNALPKSNKKDWTFAY